MADQPLTRARVMRMIWIDAFIEAGELALRRQHLCLAFDLSIPQASHDLRTYQQLFPDRLIYDRSAKCYRAKPGGSGQVFDDAAHSAIFLACQFAAAAAERLNHA